MIETIAGNRVTLITLGVDDLERAKAYYAAVGFEAEDGPPTVAFYRCDGCYFGLFPRVELAKEQGRDPASMGTGAASLSQNYSDRAGVDAAHARALGAGATLITMPVETFWGGYSGYVSDPDGHVWEFAHNPFWPLDSKGNLK